MPGEGNQELVFDRVEGAKPASVASCSACQRSVPDVYYESAGKVFCAQCKDAALASMTGGSRVARVMKALVLGTVAAAISAGVWYAIIALTGYELGIVAIAVGIAVGVAVRMGSEGRGGLAYQLIAVLLTYVAIGSSYVPLVMEQVRRDFDQTIATEGEGESEGESAEGAPPLDPDAREAAIFATSVAVGLALPVLQVMDGGVIGLLIVGFALYQAWKINTRQSVAFNGPFRVDAPSPSSAA
jgi:hypothetical protein